MEVKVCFFGILTDHTPKELVVKLEESATLNALKSEILLEFPTIEALIHAIAINNEFVTQNVTLKNGDEIAFMPAYSGG